MAMQPPYEIDPNVLWKVPSYRVAGKL